jgi:hypothetical protein
MEQQFQSCLELAENMLTGHSRMKWRGYIGKELAGEIRSRRRRDWREWLGKRMQGIWRSINVGLKVWWQVAVFLCRRNNYKGSNILPYSSSCGPTVKRQVPAEPIPFPSWDESSPSTHRELKTYIKLWVQCVLDGESNCAEMSFPNPRTMNKMRGIDIGILSRN